MKSSILPFASALHYHSLYLFYWTDMLSFVVLCVIKSLMLLPVVARNVFDVCVVVAYCATNLKQIAYWRTLRRSLINLWANCFRQILLPTLHRRKDIKSSFTMPLTWKYCIYASFLHLPPGYKANRKEVFNTFWKIASQCEPLRFFLLTFNYTKSKAQA